MLPGLHSFWSLQGRIHFRAFSSFQRPPAFLDMSRDPFLYLQSQKHSIFKSHSLSLFLPHSLLLLLLLTLYHNIPDSVDISSDLKILNLSTSSLLPFEVMYSQDQGIRMQTSWRGLHFSTHHYLSRFSFNIKTQFYNERYCFMGIKNGIYI